MPPRRTSQLFAFMGMSPEQVITVRACTDRKNLRYNVLKVEKDIKTSLISSVKRFRDKEHLLDGTAKMMIFCPTIVAVADIAKQLEKENIDTVVYMGKTLTREEKEQAWDRFISPTGPFVLVGTHAAGLGADYSNIRHVLYIRSMLQLRTVHPIPVAALGGMESLRCLICLVGE